MSLLTVIAMILGACLGSYAHATAGRLFVSSQLTRSRCLSCNHTLAWYDLIPLVSFVTLAGRCRYCRTKLPWSLLLMEVAGASLGALVYVRLISGHDLWPDTVVYGLYYAVFLTLFSVLALYDAAHRVIPVRELSILAALSLLMGAYRLFYDGFDPMVLLSPLVVMLPYGLLYIFSRGKWVGLGDVALLGVVGLFFPVVESLSVFVFSLWIGTLFVMVRTLRGRKTSYVQNRAVPFVPAIFAGFLIVLLSGYTLVDMISALGAWYA